MIAVVCDAGMGLLGLVAGIRALFLVCLGLLLASANC